MGLLAWLRRWLRGPSTSAQPLAGLDAERTRLVVGLGNPGREYADTRHNLGFRCVDLIAQRAAAPWQDRTADLEATLAVLPREGGTLVLAKPQTFMNRSGAAVRQLLEVLQLPLSQALVVYDEMDLPFGTLRLRQRGSPGTHNGMRSVVSAIQTDAIPRLRIGIGQSRPGEATAHVLSEFTPDERASVDALLERAADAALEWAEHGAVVAMNRYNNS